MTNTAAKKPATAHAATEKTTPVSAPADLLRTAARLLLDLYVGHTENNAAALAMGNRRMWAPALLEIVGLIAEDSAAQLYTGPTREETAPGKWKGGNLAKNTAGNLLYKLEEIRDWYAPLHRKDAARLHAAGLKVMGWKDDHPLAWFQPTLSECYKISTAADPVKTATALATDTETKASTSSDDGLTREERTALNAQIRALIKTARKGGKWGGTLAGLKHDYTPEQITASIARVTKDADDADQWRTAMAEVIAPDPEPTA